MKRDKEKKTRDREREGKIIIKKPGADERHAGLKASRSQKDEIHLQNWKTFIQV